MVEIVTLIKILVLSVRTLVSIKIFVYVFIFIFIPTEMDRTPSICLGKHIIRIFVIRWG
ncbi:conserved hypothetical protein [Oenococcus oeni]|nr:conserved hypothetical protein [Oenococcus oeni]